jgi:hypothetical protein
MMLQAKRSIESSPDRRPSLNEALKWITSGLNVGAVGAAIAFAFSVFQFVAVRRRESLDKEFDKYHLLIERLVSPNQAGVSYLDRQIATVFELRHFPRYFECTERILTGLKEAWGGNPAWSRLLQEMDLTLAFIRSHR